MSSNDMFNSLSPSAVATPPAKAPVEATPNSTQQCGSLPRRLHDEDDEAFESQDTNDICETTAHVMFQSPATIAAFDAVAPFVPRPLFDATPPMTSVASLQTERQFGARREDDQHAVAAADDVVSSLEEKNSAEVQGQLAVVVLQSFNTHAYLFWRGLTIGLSGGKDAAHISNSIFVGNFASDVAIFGNAAHGQLDQMIRIAREAACKPQNLSSLDEDVETRANKMFFGADADAMHKSKRARSSTTSSATAQSSSGVTSVLKPPQTSVADLLVRKQVQTTYARKAFFQLTQPALDALAALLEKLHANTTRRLSLCTLIGDAFITQLISVYFSFPPDQAAYELGVLLAEPGAWLMPRHYGCSRALEFLARSAACGSAVDDCGQLTVVQIDGFIDKHLQRVLALTHMAIAGLAKNQARRVGDIESARSCSSSSFPTFERLNQLSSEVRGYLGFTRVNSGAAFMLTTTVVIARVNDDCARRHIVIQNDLSSPVISNNYK